MEHRWGQRVGVDIPVRITAHPFFVRAGRLANLSVSGALIRAGFELRLLARIQVAIELPQRSKHEAPTIPAYVARKFKDCIGIEWCEFAPPAVTRLLQSFTTRPHIRLRKPEPSAAVAITRLSGPLLKHGT
ncbi:MAG: hypothetical protein JWN43_3197 [Gammaproteobacteria bacterium]|nr:hypothetical protein [Gammaproteobacteria bacterium]